MRRLLVTALLTMAVALPASAITPQQQRMKDCNSQASGMTGDSRKSFMSKCLSGGSAETKKPYCTKGKLCGNSCIAKNEVCHQ
jgi:hypothetical protein